MYSVATKANEPTATDKTAAHDGPRVAAATVVMGGAPSLASAGLADELAN
jgi:hypothetical protein